MTEKHLDLLGIERNLEIKKKRTSEPFAKSPRPLIYLQIRCHNPILDWNSGRSSAWLERLLWEQEVARSNRVAPTRISFLNSRLRNFLISTATCDSLYFTRVAWQSGTGKLYWTSFHVWRAQHKGIENRHHTVNHHSFFPPFSSLGIRWNSRWQLARRLLWRNGPSDCAKFAGQQNFASRMQDAKRIVHWKPSLCHHLGKSCEFSVNSPPSNFAKPTS